MKRHAQFVRIEEYKRIKNVEERKGKDVFIDFKITEEISYPDIRAKLGLPKTPEIAISIAPAGPGNA